MLIKVNSQNTTSGNPQRGWIQVTPEGTFVQFFDEGYDEGGLELRSIRLQCEPEALSINVTVKEYKRIKGLRA